MTRIKRHTHPCKAILLLVAMLCLLSGCNTLKFVPEDKMLLRNVHVKMEDRKQINQQHKNHPESLDADALAEKMRGYIQQKGNSRILGFWPLQVQVYSLAGKDTSKWINRKLQQIGEAPEVFDPMMADISVQQLTKGMKNNGYFNVKVDTAMRVKNRKLHLDYHILAEQPYTIRQYQTQLSDPTLERIAESNHSEIKEGMLFNVDAMDTERERITRGMRRLGYFYFEKSYLKYVADSALLSHQVKVTLTEQDALSEAPDSIREKIFTTYYIRQVHFYTDFDTEQAPDSMLRRTTRRGNWFFTTLGKKLLRERVLQRNCVIVPGEQYDVTKVERTYSMLNALGPVKYVDISFDQVGKDSLDCSIVMSRSKLNSVSANLEGTYSAGDWGIAAGLGYTNKNLFHGAEEFNINASCSYEWRQNGGRALEAQGEASIRFTNAPKVTFGYRYQNRPDEFTRTIANISLSYSLHPYRKRLSHIFNFLDVSYVYLPKISDEFRQRFLQPTNLLRFSYEDHFIMDWSYSGSYSSYNERRPYRSYGTLMYQVETAGNLLYGMSKLFNQTPNSDGAYEIFNIRYAQYAKADLNMAYHQIFTKNHRLVYHAALGVAVPFLNSSSVPFEKRYFSGGANSVRGWQIRSLGPGGYRGQGTRIDYNNQAGDIKLDLNLEYRWKVWSVFELAFFTDAGNIWTIQAYDGQPHGCFSKDFYKEIAWSYGLGLRLDFSFFVFRVDFGVKLYDPSRLYYDNKQWRTAPNGLGWKDDMTFHFAIGYPF